MEESYDIPIQSRHVDRKRSPKMEDKGWPKVDKLAILTMHSHLADHAYILYHEKLRATFKNWINIKF